ncbi:fumarylacetoacetate hydrolase family protein [Pararoseomonas sp. SCSIO 73927]|uniref:fumarylacetoacetate hydrolase family protein n=1 Tax=Pararoseomonas sp. SCSIO 73927 TaxID=3114537 RepID=UPI0030CFBBAB
MSNHPCRTCETASDDRDATAIGTERIEHAWTTQSPGGRCGDDGCPRPRSGAGRDATRQHAVGLDMTRRDLQTVAKEKRHRWEAAKSFDQSAPCSAIMPVARSGHPREGRLVLTANGNVATEGDLKDMNWSVPEIISHLSATFGLAAGDLICTGTPNSVGRVGPGALMAARIGTLPELRTPVVGT